MILEVVKSEICDIIVKKYVYYYSTRWETKAVFFLGGGGGEGGVFSVLYREMYGPNKQFLSPRVQKRDTTYHNVISGALVICPIFIARSDYCIGFYR